MPTHVVINNEPDKKDKKTLDFLKAEIITIKMIGHSVSLVKKKTKFYKACSICAPRADGILGAVNQSCRLP